MRRERESLPVAFTTAVLLGLLWVLVCETGLGKVFWKMLVWVCGAVGESSVVTVIGLV
jgi:hypothetical protein